MKDDTKTIIKQQIFICPASEHYFNIVFKIMQETKKIKLVYLGENSIKYEKIISLFSGKGEIVEIGDILQETAERYRKSYIDYLGTLSCIKNSFSWWTTTLSEKNQYISKVFHQFCYITISLKYEQFTNKDKKYPVVFFVEDRVVRKSIQKNMYGDEIELKVFERPIYTFLYTKIEFFTFFFKWIYFISVITRKIIYSRNKLKNSFDLNKDAIFLLSYADCRSFTDEKYTDSYFSELIDTLIKNGKNVIIIPMILGDFQSYKVIGKKIMHSGMNYLFLESWLHLSDLVSVIIQKLKGFRTSIQYSTFHGVDISDLIYEDFRNNFLNTRIDSLLLLYHLIKRLHVNKIPVDTFISTFENRIREKIMVLALHRFYPNCYYIGYQHSTLSRMNLEHFFSRSEETIIPLPDRIVTTGNYTKRLLIENGYPPQSVICGGAYRYTYLIPYLEKDLDLHIIYKNREKKILFSASIDLFDSIEMFWKIYQAFKKSSEYTIFIKLHPLMHEKLFLKQINDVSLPDNFILTSEPIRTLLQFSDVLLFSNSTTGVEALACGVPAIQILSDIRININIFDNFPEDVYSNLLFTARSSIAIKRKIDEIFSLDPIELKKMQDFWRKCILDLFEPVTPDSYKAFLRDIT